MTLPKDFKPFLLKCANGNQSAAKFLEDIAIAARLADDIQDTDGGNVADLLIKCLIDIPANPFFRDNFALLAAPMNEAILSWEISDEWRGSGERKKETFGYVYREATDRIAFAVAFITGGSAHARTIIEELFEVCHGSKETVEQWVAGD